MVGTIYSHAFDSVCMWLYICIWFIHGLHQVVHQCLFSVSNLILDSLLNLIA